MTARTSLRTTCRLLLLLALASCVALGAGCREGSAPAQGGSAGMATEGTSAPGQTSGAATPATAQPGEQSGTRSAPEAQPTQVASPVRQESVPQPATLEVGTTIAGTLQGSVSTTESHVGDAVVLRITPVVAHGRTVVPAGSTVHGRVTHVRAAGRVKGAAELTVRFTELELPTGERVEITCEPLRRVAKGDGRESVAEIGGGTAVGSVLGGVLGGRKGALGGAAVGAAVGTGVAVATKGQQITLPSGQPIQVTLTAPVTLASGQVP